VVGWEWDAGGNTSISLILYLTTQVLVLTLCDKKKAPLS
jgi:hypothetical protein